MYDSRMKILESYDYIPHRRSSARHPAESSGIDNVSLLERGEFSRRHASHCSSSVRQKLSSLGPSSRAPRKQRDLQHKTQPARVSCSRTKAGDRFYIGIYEMDGLNTPGVGTVPDAHYLASIPEAHCYLKRGSQRIDVTSARAESTSRPLERFLVEHEIAPEQAGNYKSQFHQEFLRGWMKSASRSPVFSFDNLWAVRETCIRALEIHS